MASAQPSIIMGHQLAALVQGRMPQPEAKMERMA